MTPAERGAAAAKNLQPLTSAQIAEAARLLSDDWKTIRLPRQRDRRRTAEKAEPPR